MRISWGNKLMLVFIVFGTMMSYLVYSSIKTKVDLVSKEYYKDELMYQQVIDGAKHASILTDKFVVLQSGDEIFLRLPSEMKEKPTKGVALFYYAADARRDQKIDLAMNNNGEQSISRALFHPGTYTVKIAWACNENNYYAEQSIEIR